MSLPVASAAGIAAGAAVALGFFVLPSGLLDSLSDAAHLPALLPAAEAPLGFTARSVLALGFGTLAGGGAWLGLEIARAPKRLSFHKGGVIERTVPVLRRADAHPDAPPREPLRASRDLGTPFLDVRKIVDLPPAVTHEAPVPEAVRTIPADLDTPLAAYAPQEWCPAPAPAPEPAPRAAALDEGERIEAFELKPVAGPAQRPGEHPASLQALLDRLEHGIAQRPIGAARDVRAGQDTAFRPIGAADR